MAHTTLFDICHIMNDVLGKFSVTIMKIKKWKARIVFI